MGGVAGRRHRLRQVLGDALLEKLRLLLLLPLHHGLPQPGQLSLHNFAINLQQRCEIIAAVPGSILLLYASILCKHPLTPSHITKGMAGVIPTYLQLVSRGFLLASLHLKHPLPPLQVLRHLSSLLRLPGMLCLPGILCSARVPGILRKILVERDSLLATPQGLIPSSSTNGRVTSGGCPRLPWPCRR